MAVATLGALNAESFCERVLSCVKLVVSDLLEYMRASYPDTPLSEFKEADTYVHTRGGVETLDDDEDDQ